MREIDTEHNWFWQEGYRDAIEGRWTRVQVEGGRWIMVPDEVSNMTQRSDYFAGFRVGMEDRAAAREREDKEKLMRDLERRAAEYLLSIEYRPLLRRAIAARIATTSNTAPHMKALDLLHAAFPEDEEK